VRLGATLLSELFCFVNEYHLREIQNHPQRVKVSLIILFPPKLLSYMPERSGGCVIGQAPWIPVVWVAALGVRRKCNACLQATSW
jgi:hypothetical protein